MDSARPTAALPAVGFPIRKPPDQSLVSGSPKLIAATRVLHRLLSPRHPSCALSSLVIVSSRPALARRLVRRRPGSSPVAHPWVNKRRSRHTSCLLFLRICNCQRASHRGAGYARPPCPASSAGAPETRPRTPLFHGQERRITRD